MSEKIAIVLAVVISQAVTCAFADGISSGEALVTSQCGACHAIGPTGESPNPKSPPFRDIVKRYPPENLIEALGEGLSVGHSDMPEFIFEPDEIMSIVNYLGTLRAH